jgi:exodeoxyribonuclease-1
LKTAKIKQTMVEALKPTKAYENGGDVDGALYEGFFGLGDKNAIVAVRNATPATIGKLTPQFSDPRLPELFLRYKARNMLDTLSDSELGEWEAYRTQRISSDLPKFSKSLEECAEGADTKALSLLGDLQLWAQSIIPIPE